MPHVYYSGPRDREMFWRRQAAEMLKFARGPLTQGNLTNEHLKKRFEDGTVIEVSAVHNLGEVEIVKISVPGYKGYKEEKKRGQREIKKSEYRKWRNIVIGLEYTDGRIYTPDLMDYYYADNPDWEYISGWYDYLGYGIRLGRIAGEDGEMPFTGDVEWDKAYFLKTPWQSVGGVGGVYTAHQRHQGPPLELRYRKSGPDWEQSGHLQECQEVLYDPTATIQITQEVDVHGHSAIDNDEEGMSDDMMIQWQKWYTTYTRKAIVNGVEVGTFVWTEHHYQIIHVISGLTPPWSAWAEEYITYSGQYLSSVAGVMADAGNYLYSLYGWDYNGECVEYIVYSVHIGEPTSWSNEPRDSSVYTGNITYKATLCCSGDNYTIMDTTIPFNKWKFQALSGFRQRCTRIFRYDLTDGEEAPKDNEGLSKDNSIFLYSFWEPELLDESKEDEEYMVVPTRRRFGYVYGGQNNLTKNGYPAVGIVWPDSGETDYDYDHCIVDGVPDGYYGSNLIRALIEDVEEESWTTETIEE